MTIRYHRHSRPLRSTFGGPFQPSMLREGDVDRLCSGQVGCQGKVGGAMLAPEDYEGGLRGHSGNIGATGCQ
jgi:hypothetical protein